MATTPKTIRIGATMDVTLRRLRRNAAAFVPDGTVTFTLFDALGDPVAGAVEVPMPYVAGTHPDDGVYTAQLDAVVTAGLADGAAYTILMIAGAPGSIFRPFPLACVAQL
jgi:hypothetical protein